MTIMANISSVLLQPFESLSPSSHVLLPASQAVHAVHLVASSRCVDVSHRSKRGLDPAGHLSQQTLKVGHPLLVYDNPASLEVRIAVSEHENVLHDGL